MGKSDHGFFMTLLYVF